MRNKEDIKRRYDKLYSVAYGHKKSGVKSPTTSSHVESLLSQVGRKLSKSDIILEIGCGEGNMMFPLCDKVKFMYGVDISKVAIDNAKRFLKDKNNMKLYVNDNIDFFDDEFFDIIFEQTVFQHMLKEHIIEYLDQIKKKLKEGGYLILQFIDDPSFKEQMGTLDTESQSSWTEEEMIFEIEKRGLYKVKSNIVALSTSNAGITSTVYLLARKK